MDWELVSSFLVLGGGPGRRPEEMGFTVLDELDAGFGRPLGGLHASINGEFAVERGEPGQSWVTVTLRIRLARGGRVLTERRVVMLWDKRPINVRRVYQMLKALPEFNSRALEDDADADDEGAPPVPPPPEDPAGMADEPSGAGAMEP